MLKKTFLLLFAECLLDVLDIIHPIGLKVVRFHETFIELGRQITD